MADYDPLAEGGMMAIILELPGFYVYPWQNRLTEARALVGFCGYQISEEIAVGDNDLKLDIVLPAGVSREAAREKFLSVLNQSGFTLILQEPVSPVVTPPAPPEPPLPWWAFLKVTQPRTKVYTAHDRVDILRSVSVKIPPQVSDKARVAMITGTGYDVWAAPLPGSEWICVYDGDADTGNPQPGFVLWVSGKDMRAVP